MLILIAHPASKWINSVSDPKSESRRFAHALDAESSDLQREILFVQAQVRKLGPRKAHVALADYFERKLNDRNFSISVFRNDELVLWSDNSVSPVSVLRAGAQGVQVQRLENGWYRLLYLTDGVDEYCGAILIKNAFPYENKYLSNTFAPALSIPGLKDISKEPSTGAVELQIGSERFYLHFGDSHVRHQFAFWLLLIAYVAGIIGLFAGLYLLYFQLSRRYKPWVGFALIAAIAILLRYAGISAGWPEILRYNPLFAPTLYASSKFYPSLFDFVLNALTLSFLARLFANLVARSTVRFHKTQGLTVLGLASFGVFTYAAYINHLLKGLVLNSNIPFEINNILDLHFSSFFAIGGAFILLYSFYDAARALLITSDYLKSKNDESKLVAILVATGIYVAGSHLLQIRDMISVLWPCVALLLLMLAHSTGVQRKSPHLGWIMIAILISGGVAAYNFLKYGEQREINQRQLLAEKLAIDEDPVAEILYPDVVDALRKDRSVQNVFEENELHSREILEDYVLSRYFNGYWSKYDIHLYCFDSDSTIWGKLPDIRPKTFQEIRREIFQHGVESQEHPGLYYMYNSKDLITYIAIVPLYYSRSEIPDGYFVFEMGSKFFPRQVGFPSLLIDGSSATGISDLGYSSARYIDNLLIQSQGPFSYQSHFPKNAMTGDQFYKLSFGGYNHLVNQIDGRTVLMISRAIPSWLDKATTFSYLCVLFGLLLLASNMLIRVVQGRALFDLNLNQKIQTLLVVLTLASLLLFAFATRYYIEKNFTQKNSGQISEKMQSILLELKSKLGEEEALEYDMSDMLNQMLNRLSFIFFTDINIYSPGGNLVGSSQIRMFNEGLISRTIDPTAFGQMAYYDQIEYIHAEEIGSLAYYSGYTPFYNSRGDLLAYINLPYFAKQKELDNEISRFLVAVINIFVLLFLISIFVGLLTTQWITSPLRSIRESLAEVQFGRNNALLQYRGSDEIGRLVAEYNAKVGELAENAERLAQSERESAWREMAKQVAHEIKNPLTPMKLRVQHAMRSVEQTGNISAEQFKPLADSLVEQIDALSAIASAFSDFARMPQAQSEAVDLWSLVEHTAGLYKGYGEVTFVFDNRAGGKAIILGDKKQLIRVLNNIIKNATQALEGANQAQITISLEQEANGYKLTVSDNGVGIRAEARPYLFTPNFTTKTTGMGLGLAISKNIVEQAGGKIWFESSIGIGTQFFIWLPAIHSD